MNEHSQAGRSQETSPLNQFNMKNPASIFILISGILFSVNLNAQEDLTKPVPFDPEIRTGKLQNGLTYFIRSNKEPQKRASFYFIQNVGALLENDNQNGLAHFLEHMAFNGTLHFPGKALISSLEKHGVAFGTNINAYTGQDETIYNLSDVPVDSPGLTDSCLLALYDWSHSISLTEKEIDAERPVITEEWRTRRDADFRMSKQYLPILLKDSKYAVRDVIGDITIINNFSYSTLNQFYYRWYRPDLQAVAVSGDFDANEMENKIRSLFSQLKTVENPDPRPVFEVPAHGETYYVLATDKEATQSSVELYIIRKGTDPGKKNLGYLREQLMIRLMNSMMSTRINDLLQKGNPPVISGSIRYSELVRGYDVLNISATAKSNQEELALRTIYREAERAKRWGFTSSELERAKSNLLTGYENFYKQKDKIPNDQYISQMEEYFLTNEPCPSIDFEYDFVKNVVPLVTPEQVSLLFRNLISEENRVILVTGPDDKSVKHITESESKNIIRDVQISDIQAYRDIPTSGSLITGELSGSKVIRTREVKQFGAIEWILSNNARVVFRKAGFEKDNVILSAYSMGGTSLYELDMLPSATMLPAIIGQYGIGDFDYVTLQKMMSGKNAGASINLGELTQGITGTSSVKDFEIMMQLLYLRFEKPRFDKEAYEAIMTRYSAFLANMAKDPSKIMQDSVSLFLTNFSPRTMIMNMDFLKLVDFEKIRKIYVERFRDASDFTFFITGNISEDTAKLMAEKYIGSIKGSGRKENFIDRKVMPPKGRFVKDVRIPLAIPKATVFISHNAPIKYTSYNNVTLKVIQGILDIVLTEKVREEAGGTYDVSINIGSQKFPGQKASSLIMFDCDPAKAEELKAIIYRELNNLITAGPDKVNLGKSVTNLLKNREESKLHNAYWSNALYAYYFTGIDVNDPENYEVILKRLTVPDIMKVAKQLFSGTDQEDIVFRPANQ
jgi:zinc protease